jgi:glycosyltransferase involved in cell wall biosynthesis
VKVAFVFLHPFSGSLGSTVRVRELASSLGQFGVESFILTPYEKSKSISEKVNVVSIGGIIQELGLSNYFYQLTKMSYYNPFILSKLILNQKFQKITSRISGSILNVVRKLDVDLVQTEQDFSLFASLDVKKKISLPFLIDLHNITSEELVAAKTISRGSKEFDALQVFLSESLQQIDSIIVVSNEMKNYVVTNYDISPSKVIVVPPGGRIRTQKVEKKVLPNKVVYSGLISYREHSDLFLRSMPTINHASNNTEFYLTRKGRKLKEMQTLARALGVKPNFFWFSKVNEFYDFLSTCNVGILPSSNDLARQMGTPVKLFDYFSVGLPVVANDVGTWTNIIKEEKVGIVTEDNPSDFAAAVLELIENKDFCLECGFKGLDLVKRKYNWDNSAKILFNEYCRLTHS